MPSRFWPRSYALALGAAAMAAPRRRKPPVAVRRLLVVHHLLFGDTIMLAPLLKKARSRYPGAEIVMACPRAYAGLFAGRPYGVQVAPLDARSLGDHRALRRRGGFDLALVPGDNRWSWLARAAGAGWVVAFAPDERTYKDWPVDELKRLPQAPAAWADIAAGLLPGPEPEPYAPGEWPAPPFAPFAVPAEKFCVMHLGARNPNRHWPPERWRALVDWAEAKGLQVVLSTGPGEEALAAAVDPEGTRSQLAGRLDLAQLWALLARAAFLVCPDTGIAHLAKVVGVPAVVIYGQGSPVLHGKGRFWAHAPYEALWDPDVACRDQDDLFGRRVTWLRKCTRFPDQCADPFCMRRVDVAQVTRAIEGLLTRT